eukprot:TRINITY_DN3306_c0_g1_i3.p1 TRINITY_DN3306_c0_g1~~TRINITY_DN3306_c0_g1_i3.p1  ORF type:complete len:222 (-),score=31.35 TRINITY_DN3306_c0_g1_i3:46-711(-)
MADLVCVYHESTVYSSDLVLLRPPNWVNDSIITFWLQYLQHSTFAQRNDFLFVTPGSVFILVHENDPEDLASTINGLEFPGKSLVFLPINNNGSLERVGGSHWSMLVCDMTTSSFLHFDSASSENAYVARRLAKKLAPHMPDEAKESRGWAYSEIPSPQQKNGYDCGVYAMAFAEKVAELFNLENSLANSQTYLADSISAANVSQKRQQIRDTIQSVASSS